MKRLNFIRILSVALLFTLPVFAAPKGEDWNVEHEIPEFTLVGEVSDAERVLAKSLRQELLENLTYWKNHGLPNPPDLTGIYYMSNFQTMTVEDLIKAFNPNLPNVKEHIFAQYEHFKRSKLWSVIKYFEGVIKGGSASSKKKSKKTETAEVEKPVAAPAETPAEGAKDAKAEKKLDFAQMFFSQYVKLRYGFSTPDVIEDLTNGRKYSEVADAKSEMVDNAFYAQTLRMDLTDVLPLASEKDVAGQVDWNALIDTKKFMKIQKTTEITPRIVILPRSTQGANDMSVTTLADSTVTTHELGHHIITTMGEKRPVHRMIHEVFADYLAAAPTNDPKIGEFFAQASGTIAERLKGGAKEEREIELVRAFERLAEKEVLRDMAEFSNIDTLDRSYRIANEYDGGNPLRKMMWELRKERQAKGDVEALDEIVLDSLRDFSFLPSVMSTRTSLWLMVRSLITSGHSYLKLWNLKRKVTKALPAAIEFTPAENVAFKETISKEIAKLEAKKRSSRIFWQRLGMGKREAISADYVLPEFLRVMYRRAQAESPELAANLRSRAEQLMNSKSILVQTKSGTEELVFTRSRLDKMNLVARLKVKSILSRLEIIRPEITALTAAAESDEAVTPKLEKAKSTYARLLEGLQEYERTGSTFKLFWPHPFMDAFQGVISAYQYLRKKKTEKNKTPPPPTDAECKSVLM